MTTMISIVIVLALAGGALAFTLRKRMAARHHKHRAQVRQNLSQEQDNPAQDNPFK